MRRLILAAAPIAVLVALAAHDATAAIYRWTDPAGGLHFSNRPEIVPPSATEVELPPLPLPRRVARPVLASAPIHSRAVSAPRAGTCITDPTGVVSAVHSRLAGSGALEDLTLFVAGVPVAYQPGTVTVVSTDGGANGSAALEQGAIAYPSGAACPTRPPLARYAVAQNRRIEGRSLCDDFQRAFAEVGVAVSRDQGVARSFRAIAEHFVDVAARGYVAEGAGGVVAVAGVSPLGFALEPTSRAGVTLPPWLVEAHIAQTAELGAETGDLVDELTVALEEIDRAARARGCW